MVSYRSVTLSFAILLGGSAAFAQTTVSAAGGVTIPLGTQAEIVNTGYNASLALNAKPPLAAVGIRLEGIFNSFGYKDASSGNRTERVLGAIANATLSNPSTPLRTFYVIGGLGMYNTKVVGATSQKGNNDIGFNIGLGMNLTTAVGTFVEFRYHHIPSEVSTMRLVPVSFGLRF